MVPVVKEARDNLLDILSTSEKHTIIFAFTEIYEGDIKHNNRLDEYLEFSLQFPSYKELLFLQINCTMYRSTCKDVFVQETTTTIHGMYLFPEHVVHSNESYTLQFEFQNTINVINILKTLRGTSETFNNLASDFTRQKFMRSHQQKQQQQQQKSNDSKDDEHMILEVALNIIDKTEECIQYQTTIDLCNRYIKWMKYFITKDSNDLGCISEALNDANKKLGDGMINSKQDYTIARVEIDILNAFVKPLFG